MKTVAIRVTGKPDHTGVLVSQVELDLFREAVLLDLGIVTSSDRFVIDSDVLCDGWLDVVPRGIANGLIAGDFEVWYRAALAMISEQPLRVEYQLGEDGQVGHWCRLEDDEPGLVTHEIEISREFMREVFSGIRFPLPGEPIKLDDYQAVIEVVETEAGSVWGSPEFRDALDAHHRSLRVEQMHAAIAVASSNAQVQPHHQLGSPRRIGAGL